MRPIFLLIPLALWAAPAPAATAAEAGPRSLTLHQAIVLAVRHNPGLAAVGADMSIADAGVVAARGMDDLVLEASGSWQETRRDLVAGRPVQEPASDEVSGGLQLLKPLPTGGRLGLRLLGDYNRTQFATEIDPMMPLTRSAADTFAPSLQLTFAHPLLRGFGVDVARAPQRRAKVQQDLAVVQREGAAAELVRDVVIAYWDLAYGTQELAIRRSAAASGREQLRRVLANIEVGKQPRSASAEIDVAVAFRDEAVLLAEQALADRALALGRLCGSPVISSEAAKWQASDTPLAPPRVLEETATLAAASARSPLLQAVRTQGRAAAIEVEVTDNGLLPQLDLALAGGPIGIGTEPRAAFRQLAGFGTYVVGASLVFQQPLARHAARGAHTAARETLRKARLTEEEIAQQVATAVVRGLIAVGTSRRRQEVLAKSTDAAGLDLEAEKARFEVGRSTNFDVLRRQEALAGTQLVHLRARVDHLKALAVVDALTGEILVRNGVKLP